MIWLLLMGMGAISGGLIALGNALRRKEPYWIATGAIVIGIALLVVVASGCNVGPPTPASTATPTITPTPTPQYTIRYCALRTNPSQTWREYLQYIDREREFLGTEPPEALEAMHEARLGYWDAMEEFIREHDLDARMPSAFSIPTNEQTAAIHTATLNLSRENPQWFDILQASGCNFDLEFPERRFGE